jgi:hypothetical protein
MQYLRQTFWYRVEYTRLHEDRTARASQDTHGAIRLTKRDLKRSFSTGSLLPWRIHTRYLHVKDLI